MTLFLIHSASAVKRTPGRCSDAVYLHQLVQGSDVPGIGQAGINLDAQRLSAEFIYDVKGVKPVARSAKRF